MDDSPATCGVAVSSRKTSGRKPAMTDSKKVAGITTPTAEVTVDTDRLTELLNSYPGFSDYPIPALDDLFVPAPVTPGRKNAAEKNSAATGKNIEEHLKKLAIWRDVVATFLEEFQKTDTRQRRLITDLNIGNQRAWDDVRKLYWLLDQANQQLDSALALRRIYGACDLVFAAATAHLALLTGVEPINVKRDEQPNGICFDFKDATGCTYELLATEPEPGSELVANLVAKRAGFRPHKLAVDAEGMLPEGWLSLSAWLKYAKDEGFVLLEHLPQRVRDYLLATDPCEEVVAADQPEGGARFILLSYVGSDSKWRFR